MKKVDIVCKLVILDYLKQKNVVADSPNSGIEPEPMKMSL